MLVYSFVFCNVLCLLWLAKIRGPLMVSSKRKIDQIRMLAEQHLDPSGFQSVLKDGIDYRNSDVEYIHPRVFSQNMIRDAKASLKRIVLPEGSAMQ